MLARNQPPSVAQNCVTCALDRNAAVDEGVVRSTSKGGAEVLPHRKKLSVCAHFVFAASDLPRSFSRARYMNPAA